MEIQDQRFIRYLLGELNDGEHAELEDAYFSDDAFFEHLAAVETELIDSYVQGELSPEMRARFERRHLNSPQQLVRINFARRMLRERRGTSVETMDRTAWWRKHGLLPNLRRPIFAVPVAVIAILVAVSAILWYRAEPADTGKAHLEAPRQDEPVSESGIVALSLMPGLTRSAGQGAVLTISPSDIRVRFTIEHEGEAFPAYRVVIRTPEGHEAWRESGLKPMEPGARKIVATVASERLPPADYILTLSAASHPSVYEDIADYAFLVVKRQDATGR